jgi:hypothetical protein
MWNCVLEYEVWPPWYIVVDVHCEVHALPIARKAVQLNRSVREREEIVGYAPLLRRRYTSKVLPVYFLGASTAVLGVR